MNDESTCDDRIEAESSILEQRGPGFDSSTRELLQGTRLFTSRSMTTADAIAKANENEEEYSTLSNEHPRKLIPELCRLFYQLGWVTGRLE